MTQRMFRYWGKARSSSDEGSRWHPLVYHSLDVAAVGRVYLQHQHALRHRLARLLDMNENVFLSWTTFFLALHDLGKFAEGFQAQQEELFRKLHGMPHQLRVSRPHSELGYLFWQERLAPLLEEEYWLGIKVKQHVWRTWHRALRYWARAVTGHHGKPPREIDSPVNHYFTAADQGAALEFSQTMHELLLNAQVHGSLSDPKTFARQSRRLSWWLAGIAVLADWVGSNQTYFCYRAPEEATIPEYWQYAQERAIVALKEAGVLPSEAAPAQSFHTLFPDIAEPTPLQHCAESLPLGDGPQLFFLEDVTGAGKTEAAFMLAQRFLGSRLSSGVYVGLPTTATADAIYVRFGEVYRRLFAATAEPSLILAHSTRDLSRQFRQSVLPAVEAEEQDYGDQEPTAGARCAAWLADNRKRALLAEAGVGTIDQALLAILYSKHQSLRLLGLFGKVLIVDEVHACDVYMHHLLQTLLRFHANLGGSAILLSATLPQTMRAESTAAFCEGAGILVPEPEQSAYPLLTQIGGSEPLLELPLATRPLVARRIEVEWLTDRDGVVTRIVQAARAGRCVCWIRNTVADAREAFSILTDSIESDKLILFHARFALCDRLDKEHRVLDLFGKNSSAVDRAGRVVIATQVVEQSLDLDFDLMISDLAPIDRLIQRAGRLCRHVRDAKGNRIDDPEQPDLRGTPTLLVYGPQLHMDVSVDWFSEMFPRAAKVYPDHGQLWLAGRLLNERGGFRMPEDARTLIEGVYGEEAEATMPEVLRNLHFDVEGEFSAHRSQARLNSLDLDTGYENDNTTWWDDAITPTRLGEASITVRLARWSGKKLMPWASGSKQAWQLSQVQVRQQLIASMPEKFEDPVLQTAVEKLLPELPDKGRWTVLVPLVEVGEGLWCGQASNGQGNIIVYYNEQHGLLMENEIEGQV
jgi:CRISPR-associated endonuclease/helicase Cas3